VEDPVDIKIESVLLKKSLRYAVSTDYRASLKHLVSGELADFILSVDSLSPHQLVRF
jgi:hypothetical protein